MAADGVIQAVDPHPKVRLGASLQFLIAHRSVGRIPNGTVRWVRKTGVEAAAVYAAAAEPAFSFIFIDGDHSYEGLRGDWEAWKSLVAPGGMVALHDSCSSEARQIDDAGNARFTREIVLADPRFLVGEVVRP